MKGLRSGFTNGGVVKRRTLTILRENSRQRRERHHVLIKLITAAKVAGALRRDKWTAATESRGFTTGAGFSVHEQTHEHVTVTHKAPHLSKQNDAASHIRWVTRYAETLQKAGFFVVVQEADTAFSQLRVYASDPALSPVCTDQRCAHRVTYHFADEGGALRDCMHVGCICQNYRAPEIASAADAAT